MVEENEKLKENTAKYLPSKVSESDFEDKKLFFTIETQSLLDMRVQNLAISLDKINLFLKKHLKAEQVGKQVKRVDSNRLDSNKNSENGIFKFIGRASDEEESPEKNTMDTKPFSLINEKEDRELYWSKSPDSLRSILENLCVAAATKASIDTDKGLLMDLTEFLKTPMDELRTELSKRLHHDNKIEGQFLTRILPSTIAQRHLYRRALIYVAWRLGDLQLADFHPAIRHLITMHCFALLLFRHRHFWAADEAVDIRECDLTVFSKYLEQDKLNIEDESKVVNRQVKKYSGNYLWGQLVYWMKQTIQKPDASLSAGRRGTLNLPDIMTSFGSKLKTSLPQKNRKVEIEMDQEESEKPEKKIQSYPSYPHGVISLLPSQ